MSLDDARLFCSPISDWFNILVMHNLESMHFPFRHTSNTSLFEQVVLIVVLIGAIDVKISRIFFFRLDKEIYLD